MKWSGRIESGRPRNAKLAAEAAEANRVATVKRRDDKEKRLGYRHVSFEELNLAPARLIGTKIGTTGFIASNGKGLNLFASQTAYFVNRQSGMIVPAENASAQLINVLSQSVVSG
jgi:hypothetical protein